MSQDVEKVEHVAARLRWVNGVPTIIGHTEIFDQKAASQRLKSLLTAALNLPYDGKDLRYLGLSKGEAMVMTLVDDASKGSSEARKEVIDRHLGRPQQNIKSVSLKGDLNDFLDQLQDPIEAQDELEENPDIIDVSRETFPENADDL
jgi:hypothetical protein